MFMRPITSLVALICLLLTVPPALAAPKVAKVNEPSFGDRKVFALMARQGVEGDALKRGSTLAKLCTIRSSGRRPVYTLYWFQHLTQAAEVVHGRTELIVISAARNVLGTYDYEGTDKPTCVDQKVFPVDYLPGDQGRFVTYFPADRLPDSLGDGGAFSPMRRYDRVRSVDGVQLPPLSH